MLPRWHILLGALFTMLVWAFIPGIPLFYLALIFLASFLIDFDHYVVAAHKRKSLKLNHAFDYHKEKQIQQEFDISHGIRRKGDFHLFHTVEFHMAVGLLGIFWIGFFYIFIGMVFHSFLDIFSLLWSGVFHRREFFFFNWIRKKKFKRH